MEKAEKRSGGLRLPAKASLWYIGSNILTKTVGLCATPIFTRVMSPDEYGALMLYASWVGAANLLCSAWYTASVIYRGFEKYGKAEDGFLCSAVLVGLCGTVVICVLLFFVSLLFGLAIELFPVFVFQVLCDTGMGIYLIRRRYTYSYVRVFFIGVTECLLTYIISLFLVYEVGLGYRGRILGMMIGSAAIAVPTVFSMLMNVRKGLRKEHGKYLLRGGASFAPSAVSSTVRTQADKLFVGRLYGDGALARYSVAHTVGCGASFVTGAMVSAMTPWLIRKLERGECGTVERVLRIGVRLLCCGVLWLIALSPELLLILAPREYGDARGAILPIALSTVPIFLTSLVNTLLVGCDRQREVGRIAVIGAPISLLLQAVLVPPLSYTGAGLGMLIGSLFTACAVIYRFNKEKRLRLPLADAALSFALAGELGLIISLSASYPALRVLLLIPPSLVAVREGLCAWEMIKE